MVTRLGESSDLLKCSFCGKSQKQVRKLIAGPGVYICDECIELCNEIIEEELSEVKAVAHGDGQLPTPREMFDFLEEYVVGQEKAKRALSVAVYNHYKRIRGSEASDGSHEDVEIAKSNILLMGPTGCGKTYLAQTLARHLAVPFIVADATSLTEAGYVGDDVENMLLKLLQAADYDVKKAQKGIIFIDEIDKISRKGDSASLTRDVSGEGVQQALLKIIEGCKANVPPQGGRKHPNQEFIQIDTTNILFIVSGAFAGMEDIVAARCGRKSIGFGSALDAVPEGADALTGVLPEDLVKFGLIPEFIGRLPVIASVAPLDRQALVSILTTPKNSLLKQYQKLFAIDGVELVVEAEALEAVVDLAIKRETGARGLRALMEESLMSIMFELPSREDIHTVVVTKEVIVGNMEPEIYLVGERSKLKSA